MKQLYAYLIITFLSIANAHAQENYNDSTLERIESRMNESYTMAVAYAEAKEWRKADSMMKKHDEYRLIRNRKQTELKRIQIYEQIGSNAIQKKKRDAEIRNAQIETKNAQLQLHHIRQNNLADSLASKRRELQTAQDQLARKNLEAQYEQNEQQIAVVQKKSKQQNMIVGAIILAALAFFALLTWVIIRRFRMIYRLNRNNKQLSEARDKARAADQMKSYFIQNLSHEIRTPLGAILGFCELLSDPDTSIGEEERVQLAQLIEQNSEQLTTLVGDILDLSNMQFGNIKLNIDQTPCNNICQSALNTVKHRCPPNVKMYMTTELDDDFCISTDNLRVQQVIVNFLTNACKYTTEGEIHLHCGLKETPDMVTFSVEDTGSGIPKEKADLIFKRFEKLNDMKQGTGLGLSICRNIANLLHGQVLLDTAYTNGARFLFRHPLRCLLMILALAISPISQAQDNPYKISDDLYEELLKEQKLGRTMEALQLAERLYKESIKRGDKKAECVFLSEQIRISQFIQPNRMHELAEKTREASLRNKFPQYYSWAYAQEVRSLIREKKFDEASELITLIQKKASKSNDKYLIKEAMSLSAEVKRVQDDLIEAEKEYRKLIEYTLKELPDQDVGHYIALLVKTQRQLGAERDILLKNIETGLKESKTENSRWNVLIEKCKVYSNIKFNEEFKKTFQEFDALTKKLNKMEDDEYKYQLCYYNILTGQYEQAHKLAEKLPKSTKLLAQAEIYSSEKDHQKAYLFRKEIADKAKNMSEEFNEISAMNAKVDRIRMQDSLQVIQLENAKLIKERAQLELDSVLMLNRNLSAKSKNDSLQAVSEHTKAKLAQLQLEIQEEKISSIHEEQQRRNYMLAVVLSAVVGIILIYLISNIWQRQQIQQLKQLHIKLNEALKEAQQSDMRKNEFIQDLSHEIRTPLNSIVGFSDLLIQGTDGMDKDEVQMFRNTIKTNAHLLNSMVNDILELSRMENQRIDLRLEETPLNQLCQSAINRYKDDSHGLRLVMRSDLPDSTTLRTDARRLLGMLKQLVGNAIKFTPSGVVRLLVTQENELIRVAVEDTGIGIPEELKDKVFEHFTKADPFSPGTGLGLSLAKATADLLSMNLYLDKEFQGGTRFVLDIPLEYAKKGI